MPCVQAEAEEGDAAAPEDEGAVAAEEGEGDAAGGAVVHEAAALPVGPALGPAGVGAARGPDAEGGDSDSGAATAAVKRARRSEEHTAPRSLPWTCPLCAHVNKFTRNRCQKCHQERA